MKLLLYSNAPWAPTGYGTQIAQLARSLVTDGHEVAIAANYGLEAAWMNWEGIAVAPRGYDQYSNDLAPAHAAYWFRNGPGWVLTLYDVWVLEQGFADLPHVASWTPVDHKPVPPRVVQWCSTHPTIAMSRFGERELGEVGVKSTYIPHSLNLEVFHPTTELRGNMSARTAMGIPEDAFVVMVNAANKGTLPNRKAFPEMLMALGYFMQQHPDVWVYMHTEAQCSFGIDLFAVAKVTHIPAERMTWAPRYEYRNAIIQPRDMAALYTSADVLLATSRGEGFGIPVIEAQACGTPVIVSDFSAQPELLGAGWKVGGQPDIDPTLNQAVYLTPNIGEIVAALEESYQARGDTNLRDKGIEKAQEYDHAKVYPELWRPYMAHLEEELGKPVPNSGPNRYQRRLAKRAKRAA